MAPTGGLEFGIDRLIITMNRETCALTLDQSHRLFSPN